MFRRVLIAVIAATALVIIFGNLDSVFIAYAGKATKASVAIQFAAKFEIDRWIAYILGGLGIGYGAQQRRARKQIEQRSARFRQDVTQRIADMRVNIQLPPTE